MIEIASNQKYAWVHCLFIFEQTVKKMPFYANK